VLALQEIIDSTGARSEVEESIRRLLDQAMSALGRLPLEPGSAEALGEVARFVAGRDR
jgi:geranylgeranyl pyrophosphate synthase